MVPTDATQEKQSTLLDIGSSIFIDKTATVIIGIGTKTGILLRYSCFFHGVLHKMERNNLNGGFRM
jgi:hypothetical protein